MKRYLIAFALVLAGGAQALELGEALDRAPARPGAITTRLELLQARSEQIRTEGDPLALRMDRLQANQSVELLSAQLEQAVYAAIEEVAGAYTSVIEAREQLALARAGAELSGAALDIARIRLRNGSATELEVREAEIAAEEAAQGVDAAGQGLALAVANLEGMIGLKIEPDELEPVDDSMLPEVLPPLENVIAASRRHPDLLQARQGLELARTGVDLLDPAYAAPVQIESARTQLATAEELVVEAERGFELQARNAHLQASNALESLQIEQERLGTTQERLATQEARLEGGLISRIEFDQARLEAQQAQLALLQARHGYLNALLALQSATLYDLGLLPEVTADLQERQSAPAAGGPQGE